MHIHDFADLLSAAQAQPEPQRLLLVFARAELPEDASEAECEAFAQGQGGALKPVLCVDKLPTELADFTSLCAEAERTGQTWDLLFAAGLSGRAGQAPSSDEAEQPLRMMVSAIEAGSIGSFIAFDHSGEPLSLY
ncbi:ribonucleotide reductase subunit alpha [Pseudomonas sp. R-22-3w-18]|uniref:Ribonucleotide reductase subunit alpha n=2 Tax=Pseudomonas xionganensis TaxID=2654845 RepID=A0A6I4KPY0_9PSED|nr:ribonucleotide reductase subunit alpha [Pseudomonas xionganensis]MVW74104.1 ribonucleotide reductase subunit alpha [Pseudomonas xionganensis]